MLFLYSLIRRTCFERPRTPSPAVQRFGWGGGASPNGATAWVTETRLYLGRTARPQRRGQPKSLAGTSLQGISAPCQFGARGARTDREEWCVIIRRFVFPATWPLAESFVECHREVLCPVRDRTGRQGLLFQSPPLQQTRNAIY